MGELKRALPRESPTRADDPSYETVAPEALDVARYITDMTARLEAAAIAARLDRLAYFLRMANAESEIFVRINGVPEHGRESRRPITTRRRPTR
jgi:hypothetical protein